jgi:hypothetical protein
MDRPAQKVLQEEFLSARAKILELAATLDRIDRAVLDAIDSSTESSEAAVSCIALETFRKNSAALQLLAQGISILQEGELHRAKRVQELMSRPYDPKWRESWTI